MALEVKNEESNSQRRKDFANKSAIVNVPDIPELVSDQQSDKSDHSNNSKNSNNSNNSDVLCSDSDDDELSNLLSSK